MVMGSEDGGLGPEVRSVPGPTASGPWKAFRILGVFVPLLGLAVFCGRMAVDRNFMAVCPGSREDGTAAPWGGAAVGFAWQGWRSAKKTWRIHRGGVGLTPGGDALVLLGGAAASLGLAFSLALPGLLSLVRVSCEGATKGNLGAIRSALSVYYGDMEGHYPLNLESLTVAGRYMSVLPKAKTPGSHPDSARVLYATRWDDTGGWVYNNVPSDPNYGTLWTNCTHTDPRGAAWTTY